MNWKENQDKNMIVADILRDNEGIAILDENNKKIIINSHRGNEGSGMWNSLDD